MIKSSITYRKTLIDFMKRNNNDLFQICFKKTYNTFQSIYLLSTLGFLGLQRVNLEYGYWNIIEKYFQNLSRIQLKL